jgi:hypothetical protein
VTNDWPQSVDYPSKNLIQNARNFVRNTDIGGGFYPQGISALARAW